MKVTERAVLLLLALPFSTLLAAGVYWMLSLPVAYRLGAALLVFVTSEYILQRLAARIHSPVGAEAMTGREAEVLAEFTRNERGHRIGHVRLDGVRWNARLATGEAATPAPGAKVRVVKIVGLTLWVTESTDLPRSRKP